MTMPPELLEEEWVSYPNKRKYTPLKEHYKQASEQGWFRTGWKRRIDTGERVPPDPVEDV